MGNQECFCCDAGNQNKQSQVSVLTINKRGGQPVHPIFSFEVNKHLQKYKPFYNKITQTKLRKYGTSVYKGQIDQLGRPENYGMIMYQNGSVFIGQFFEGKANGPGHFVLQDGSYFHGQMQNNLASCDEGTFVSKKFKYQGQFRFNNFEGNGKQQGQNYKFQGKYTCGRKIEGKLQWIQQQINEMTLQNIINKFQYTGSFNKRGKFEGRGVLKCPKGVYQGTFKNGIKHGKGQFTFQSGLRYVGDYDEGIRSGKGTIYSKNGQLAYCGQIKNGAPNGKGYVLNNKKQQVHLQWLQGMDKKFLPDQFITTQSKRSFKSDESLVKQKHILTKPNSLQEQVRKV